MVTLGKRSRREFDSRRLSSVELMYAVMGSAIDFRSGGEGCMHHILTETWDMYHLTDNLMEMEGDVSTALVKAVHSVDKDSITTLFSITMLKRYQKPCIYPDHILSGGSLVHKRLLIWS